MNSIHPVIRCLLGLLLSLLAPSTNLVAQSSSGGSIVGRVSNEATGAYLEDARIELDPSGLMAHTDRTGNFSFDRVAPGEYSLSISYTGLDSQRVRVTVAAGAATRSEIGLTTSIYKLSPYTVSGEREGNARAIQLQRQASNVKNVVASDAFGNVADENLANFMRRMPGIVVDEAAGEPSFVRIRGMSPDLNSVTLNGTKVPDGATNGGVDTGLNRSFAMDTISADNIETIEVTKSPTPDMDADSIGGAVNLKTKSAFDQKGRRITYRVGASYNTDRRSTTPSAAFMYSDVLGADGKLGFVLTTSYNKSDKPRDSSNTGWEATLDTNRPAYFWILNYGEDQLQHVRSQAGLRLDYKLREGSTLFINGTYSYHEGALGRYRGAFSINRNVVERYSATGVPQTATGAAATVLPGWTDTKTETINHAFQFTQNHYSQTIRMWSLQAGGDHKLGALRLDYDVSFSPSDGDNKRTIPTMSVAGTGFRFLKGPPNYKGLVSFEQISGPDIFNWSNRTFPTLNFQDDVKTDEIRGAQINLRKDFNLPLLSYMKVGLRGRDQRRHFHLGRHNFSYVGADGVMGRNAATGINDDNLAQFAYEDYRYEPSYGLYPNVGFVHVPKVLALKESSPQFFPENLNGGLQQELANRFDAKEQVYAGYILGGAEIGRWGILAGVRIEETRVNGTGPSREITAAERARRAAWVGTVTTEEQLRRTQAEFGNLRSASATYRNTFPGVHLKYRIAEGLQAKASWSTSIGRPVFISIVPNENVNHDTQFVTTNNPGLRPQFSDNYDLFLEKYFEPVGMISAGVFRKDITDYIFRSSAGVVPDGPDNGFDGDYAGYRLDTTVNGGDARIEGFEFAYQQQFSSLPGFWRGFGVFANYTWLKAKGDLGDMGQGDMLPSFVPRSWNAGLSYSSRGWTVRIQGTYNSVNLGTSISADLSQQIYTPSRTPVDLNIKYDFSRNFSAYIDVINVFNEIPANYGYIYIPSRSRLTDRFSPVIKFGISGRL